MLLDTVALRALSAALDDDTASYLQDAVADAETVEDAVELISSFLEDAGDGADASAVKQCLQVGGNGASEDLARASAKQSQQRQGAETGQLASKPPPTQVLGAPVVMQEQHEQRQAVHPSAMPVEERTRDNRSRKPRKQKKSKQQAKKQNKQQRQRQREEGEKEVEDTQRRGNQPEAQDQQQPTCITDKTGGHADNLMASNESSRFQRDHIHLRGLDIAYLNGPPLLEHAELRLLPNHRYGLLGRNGSGKSTLLRVLAERRLPDFPTHVSVLYIDQEANATFDSVLQFVVAGDRELMALRSEYRRIAGGPAGDGNPPSTNAVPAQGSGDAERLMEVVEQLELVDDATAEERAKDALGELGFSEDMMHSPSSALSGGWRMKAALARALFCPPELLLLDEPTNHLDLHGVLWLQDFLTELEDTCAVVVSHDRAFLDAVATDMMVLDKQRLAYFPGNFSAYLQDKEERFRKHQHLYEAQERKRQHIQASIDKGIQQARRTGDDKVLGMVASRKKKLDRLGPEKREDGKRWKVNVRRKTRTQKQYENCNDGARQEIEAPKEDKPLVFKFPTELPLLTSGKRCFELDGVSFAYGDKGDTVLEDITFSLDLGQRVGILGRNGAGKSTLIQLIFEELSPTSGTVQRVRQAKLALFNQHHADVLDLDTSALDHMKKLFGGEKKEQELRNHLGSFGLGPLALQPMRLLSGGQKTRVSLAALVLSEPHALILDEPTNHLDYESIQALADALEQYPGAVLLVSHDRNFMSRIASEFWVLKDKHLTRFDGTLEDYVASIEHSI